MTTEYEELDTVYWMLKAVFTVLEENQEFNRTYPHLNHLNDRISEADDILYDVYDEVRIRMVKIKDEWLKHPIEKKNV